MQGTAIRLSISSSGYLEMEHLQQLVTASAPHPPMHRYMHAQDWHDHPNYWKNRDRDRKRERDLVPKINSICLKTVEYNSKCILITHLTVLFPSLFFVVPSWEHYRVQGQICGNLLEALGSPSAPSRTSLEHNHTGLHMEGSEVPVCPWVPPSIPCNRTKEQMKSLLWKKCRIIWFCNH